MGGGVASFSSKLKCIHPTLLPQQTCFFSYYLITFSLWRAGGEGEENGHSGLKTNSLKNVGTKWKEAYSHGGSVSCHWPLQLAEIMCLRGFHRGYSFLDFGTRHKDLPLTTPGHPPKKSPPPTQPSTASLFQPSEPIAGVARLKVLGSEKIKCMEYKGLNWIAFSLLLGEGSLGG